MKGNAAIIDRLNKALSMELTAINQYLIHGRLRSSWGYSKLAAKSQDEALEERGHSERLIDRILFLEGEPDVQKGGPVKVGKDVVEQMRVELEAEREAFDFYNESIRFCGENEDDGSAQVFRQLLSDEEEHIGWLEQQLDLIQELGLQNYLARQL